MTESNISPIFKKKTKILAFVLLGLGDVFYFGSLIFRDFTINMILSLSTEISPSDLTHAGQTVLLFNTALMGAMTYLTGVFLLAMNEDDEGNRRKIMLLALATWYITDGIASLIFSFGFNVIFNTVLLLLGVLLIIKK